MVTQIGVIWNVVPCFILSYSTADLLSGSELCDCFFPKGCCYDILYNLKGIRTYRIQIRMESRKDYFCQVGSYWPSGFWDD